MSRLRRQQDRAAQRGRILDAARALFAARGFDDVTMAEVADVAGVARATVFNHYGSKHALVEGITESVIDYYVAMLDRALEHEDASTPALVRSLLEHMGWGIEQMHRFYRGVFREIMRVQVGRDEGSAPARASQRARERLERLMVRGQERGDLSSSFSAPDLATAFDSLANGTINHWLFDDPTGSLRERMRRTAEIFLGAVAADGSRADDAPLPALAPADATIAPPQPIPLRRARKRRTR
jgi:AcrR family transcriptional regulator